GSWFGGNTAAGGPQNFTDTEHFQILGPSGGAVGSVSIVAHATVNANGTLTISLERDTGTCQPPRGKTATDPSARRIDLGILGSAISSEPRSRWPLDRGSPGRNCRSFHFDTFQIQLEPWDEAGANAQKVMRRTKSGSCQLSGSQWTSECGAQSRQNKGNLYPIPGRDVRIETAKSRRAGIRFIEHARRAERDTVTTAREATGNGLPRRASVHGLSRH